MKPYFETELGALYHGDCRDILGEVLPIECVVTDPVWPGATADIKGRENPEGLFDDLCNIINGKIHRLVVQIGCDVDPRFLRSVPKNLPFIRHCWLDYAMPTMKGRILYTGDVALSFGSPPAPRKGRMLLSGMCRSGRIDKQFSRKGGNKHKKFTRKGSEGLPHPMPRRLEHVSWLVKNFCDNIVLDPFLGSGTTAIAAEIQGVRWVGIEIEEHFCEFAAKRLEHHTQQLKMFTM